MFFTDLLQGIHIGLRAAHMNRHYAFGFGRYGFTNRIGVHGEGIVNINQHGQSAYAVGANGAILRTTDGGVTWTAESSGTQAVLSGIWGDGRGELHAVGMAGTILHSADGGATWTATSSGTNVALFAVWGSASDDVYAVGKDGTILHFR